MSTKTISVNPEFFNLKNKKTKKNKKKRKHNKTVNNLQKNAIKEKLISKIKKFKKKNKLKELDTIKDTKNSFSDEYSEAFDFMEEIVKKNKKKKKKKKEISVVTPSLQTEIKPNLNKTNTSYSLVQPDPPFGILKNGNKPVYSEYMKNSIIDQNIKNDKIVITDDKMFGKNIDVNEEINSFKNDIKHKFQSRKMNLENLKKSFLKNNNIEEDTKDKNKKFKIKNKKIVKRFVLGKNKKTKKVSILIKNKKTRKVIQKDERELARKKMKDIKKFLVERSLIKAGSSAPNSLLKDLYKNCYLSGDIYNSGGKSAEENLMHNWNKNF